jgi:iron complex outermembrane receptor protein
VGGELRGHDGHHVGQVLSGGTLPPGTPPDMSYYDYHPRTFSSALFAREEWDATPTVRVTADLAWRHQGYDMRDDVFDGIRFEQPYNFALPRLGVTWTPRPAWSAFASYAYASREPSFRDLYDAEFVGAVPLFANVDPATNVWTDPLINPERVQDLELGGAWRGASSNVTLNVFRMNFRDELVFAGQFDTDLGYPILGNAARSVHQGIELEARQALRLVRDARLTFEGSATLSDNYFVEYTEQYGPTTADEVHYDGNTIGLFPAQLANLSARLDAGHASLGAELQYAGRIYVDNTESMTSSIGPRRVANVTGGLRVPFGTASHAELSLRGLNVLDERYATSGYPDYNASGALVPHFVPAATRNWIAQVRVDF